MSTFVKGRIAVFGLALFLCGPVFGQTKGKHKTTSVPPAPAIAPVAAVTPAAPAPAVAPVAPVGTAPAATTSAVPAAPAASPVVTAPPASPLPPSPAAPAEAPRANKYISHIIDDLLNKGIIDNEDKLTFLLDDEQLTVNGVKQPDEVFRPFKQKYIGHAGDHFRYQRQGSSIITNIKTGDDNH